MKTKLSNKELNELLEWFGLSDKEIHITLKEPAASGVQKETLGIPGRQKLLTPEKGVSELDLRTCWTST